MAGLGSTRGARLVLAAVGASLLVAAAPATEFGLLDLPSDLRDLCQPDPVLALEQQADILRGIDPQPQRLRCRYGPHVVTPGDNMILFGPVTIESPKAPGYITRFAPDLIDAIDGTVPPIHLVHLHHGVWINPTGGSGGTPFLATGEEKTVSEIPSPYGYRTLPTDAWIANYMIHNLTGETQTVFITYELDWLPLNATRNGLPMQPVQPLWFDVVGGVYPVYDALTPEQEAAFDLQRGGKRPEDQTPDLGDFQLEKLPTADAIVDFDTAPSGRATVREDVAGFAGGGSTGNWKVVWIGGHVHPGGLRDELVVGNCDGDASTTGPDDETVVFASDAILNGGRGLEAGEQQFGSWDFLMTATRPDYELILHDDQPVTVRTYYDAANPWYEAMGIMFAWGVPLTAAEAETAARCSPTSALGDPTTGEPTRPAPPDDGALVFGGPWGGAVGPAPPEGDPITQVNILGFGYAPNGDAATPATVRPGATIRFRNLDAYAGIYHSVTTCAAPCDQPYGQSYPLPEFGYDVGGDVVGGFDSGELGWGVPYATAATNTDVFDYNVPVGIPDGTQLTYYCRVHPQMRGRLVVDTGGN